MAEVDDERLALESIYDQACLDLSCPGAVTAFVPDRHAQPRLELHATLPADYPAAAPPVLELRCAALPAAATATLATELLELFVPGEVVLFSWIEHLRDAWQRLAPPPPPPAMELLGSATQAATAAAAAEVAAAALSQVSLEHEAARQALALVAESISHGEPVTEKRSTFQAHLAPVDSVHAVEAVLECLLANSKIRGASHPCMMAYRIQRRDAPGSLLQDCDDDGEAAAGKNLLHLLQMVDARDVVVVVTRWFGGIHLGPTRFALITNAARALLERCGYIKERPAGAAAGKKGGGKKGH